MTVSSWTMDTVLLYFSPMFDFAKKFFLGMFFVPDDRIVGHPSEMGLAFEEIRFPAFDGRVLHGYFLKSRGPITGTVLHCHGNAGNVTAHFALMSFLVEAGFNVFTFDYGGYGKSQGTPSPEGIIEDTLAALAYLRSRADVNPNKLALFGQSLGGAAASGAMARDREVSCLILEGTFATYREMAFASHLGRLLFFLTPFVIPDIGPRYNLAAIAPRPILIVHGDQDATIPVRFADTLYRAAREVKSLAVLRGFGHLDGAGGAGPYRDIILGFLNRHLGTGSVS